MASLRRHPRSPFWQAVFTLPNGVRTNRSTGTTDKRKAIRIANEYEDASREARDGRFTESKARKTIADIFSIANATRLPAATVGDFLDGWLTRKELEASGGTHERYTAVAVQFKEHLGTGKLRRDVSSVAPAEIVSFRDKLSRRISPASVNLAVKILRVAFGQARKDGLIETNPAENVSLLKRTSDDDVRRPFTLPELKTILAVADDEWRGMILAGLYTGQRLGDVATLTWNNVDLQRGEIHLVTGKTNRRQRIPIATPLLRHIESLPAGDKPDAPLFPRSCALVESQGKAGGLSGQFTALLVTAGLARKKAHKASKHGRGGRRETSELSFHSLRHTATTLLKMGGASEAVAREIIGHDSAQISRNYTHVSAASMREALNTIPDITK